MAYRLERRNNNLKKSKKIINFIENKVYIPKKLIYMY